MDNLIFEWDPAKAKKNSEKHNVCFEDAATVFEDEFAILFDDPDHSDAENRFIILGLSASGLVLTVCHCLRKNGNVIRLISARKATKKEEITYFKFNNCW